MHAAVHAHAADRVVDVGAVAREQDAALAERRGDALVHAVEVDVLDVVATGFWEEFLQPRFEPLRRERRVLVLVVGDRENRAPQPVRVFAAHLEQVAPLARVGEIIAEAQIGIDRLEFEGGRDLDELFRIGESLELDVGELAHGAAPAVAADHVVGAQRLDAARRRDLDVDAVRGLHQPGDVVRKPHVEIAGVGVLGGNRRRELVLLILQHERKLDLVLQEIEIELRDHRVAWPIVETIGAGPEAERQDFLKHAEFVEHFEARRVDRRGALILDRCRLGLEHSDGNAGSVERQSAHHTHRPRADNDNARVTLR